MTRPSILITGSSGGIGRAAAIDCASRGARIGVHYNANRALAEETLAALEGGGHSLFQCDITDPQAVAALIEDAEQTLATSSNALESGRRAARNGLKEIRAA